MTLAEIANLEVSDVKLELVVRLNPEATVDQAFVDAYEDTDQALIDELVLLKVDMSDEEQARLDEIVRRSNLEARFAALNDLRAAMHITDQPNPLLLKMTIIRDNDVELLDAIEAEDIAIKANRDATDYIKNREEEYKKIDGELMEALVEKESGDSTKFDAYMIKRNEIKTNNPKPE